MDRVIHRDLGGRAGADAPVGLVDDGDAARDGVVEVVIMRNSRAPIAKTQNSSFSTMFRSSRQKVPRSQPGSNLARTLSRACSYVTLNFQLLTLPVPGTW
jgi:hypothetical protein